MKKLLVFTMLFFLLISCGNEEQKSENDSDISSDNSVVNDEDNASDDVIGEIEDETDDDLSESTPDPDLVQNDEDADASEEKPDDEFVFEVETCKDINSCFNRCDGKEECEKCTEGVDPQLIEDYENFFNCMESNCSGKTSVEFNRCMNRYCHCEQYFCFGEEVCSCFCLPAPYGLVDIDADFNYAYVDEEDLTNDEYIKDSPFAVGKINNDLIDEYRYSTGVKSYLYSYGKSYLMLSQETIFDDSNESLDLEDAVMDVRLYFMKDVTPGVKTLGYYSTDGVSLMIFGKDRCVHAVGKGEVTVLDGQYGEHENGRINVKGNDIEIYWPYHTPGFSGSIKDDLEDSGFEICDFLDDCWRHYRCKRP